MAHRADVLCRRDGNASGTIRAVGFYNSVRKVRSVRCVLAERERRKEVLLGVGALVGFGTVVGKHWPNPEVSRIQGGKSDFLGILNVKSYQHS